MAVPSRTSVQVTSANLGDALLSWLLVQLRGSRGESVSFDWSVETCATDKKEVQYLHLASEEVFSSLEDDIATVRQTILASIAANFTELPATEIILFAGSLSTSHGQANVKNTSVSVCIFDDGRLITTPRTAVGTYWHAVAKQYLRAFETIYAEVTVSARGSINDYLQVRSIDLNDIWTWNSQVPSTYDDCMHRIISDVASCTPQKIAIDAWDGVLTYHEIDTISTRLAHYLRRHCGVMPGAAILICFEKSKWTTVAALATSKAGATIVLADPSLPLSRLQNIATQTEALTIISSRQQATLSRCVIDQGKMVVLDDSISLPEPTDPLSHIDTDILMYIIFTSGSTGVPKGVMVSHKSFTSSAYPRAAAVGYAEQSRVLDFAAYAFDVSIDSMMLTLANGGTLCIPSDEARLGDMNELIQSMKINFAALTPSVARLLTNDVIMSLSVLALGGEAASTRDVATYGERTRVVIGYGPCECTVGCTINTSAANGKPQVSIGTGNGANIWLVDPDDHDALVPVGAVGELLVEGPIVGQGYLKDAEKTASVFIDDPEWLLRGHPKVPGRSGRLYKTGDLAKYDLDGSGEIIFVGRKDTQVKLRGQRIELGEIESQIKTNLPSHFGSVVEVISPKGRPMLACFVSEKSTPKLGSTSLSIRNLKGDEGGILRRAHAEITRTLPRYMVPSAWVPVESIPALVSGKIDRKQLKHFGATLDVSTLEDYTTNHSTERPLNAVETQLRRMWANLLSLDESSIASTSNFLSLGADSLIAMKMVAACNTSGLSISVARVLENPTLSGMASMVKQSTIAAHVKLEPFQLLHTKSMLAVHEAAALCGLEMGRIDDVYPCSPVQEALFTFSLRSDAPYIAQRVARIPTNVGTDRWKSAWQSVIATIPILRTRIVHLAGQSGLHQVLPSPHDLVWLANINLETYLAQDKRTKVALGDSLCRYAIVHDVATDQVYMVWTIHHAAYDGFSEPLVIEQVHKHLNFGNSVTNTASADMRDFVKWLDDGYVEATTKYWRTELKGSTGQSFPKAPRDHLPSPDKTIERQISFRMPKNSHFTMSSLIRGVWAFLSSQHTLSNDIVFGETLVGRDIDLPGVEGIVGPLIATIPTRIRLDYQKTVSEYLHTVTRCHLLRIPHQHYGWQNIRRISRDTQIACETGCGIVIQPEVDDSTPSLGFDQVDVVQEAIRFNPYSLMLAIGLQKDGFRLCANFDSSVIEASLVERVLSQFETACLRLATNLSAKLGDISCLPDEELDIIWKSRSRVPMTEDFPTNSSLRAGSPYPPVAHQWSCNPHTGLLSPIGAHGELRIESDLLHSEAVRNPTWLLGGSPSFQGRVGQIHKTGDLVMQDEAGKLNFVGRLDRHKQSDLAMLEVERLVNEMIPAPNIVLRKKGPDGTTPVVMIMQSQAEQQTISLYVGTQSSDLGFQTSRTASKHLLQSVQHFLRAFNNIISPTLARPVVLFADALPRDDLSLARLLEGLSADLIADLRNETDQAVNDMAMQASLTSNEQVLRLLWGEILQMEPKTIEVDDNFFRLGGDSILAMKLSSTVRKEGYRLSVAEIFHNMLLKDAARAMVKMDPSCREHSLAYKPFTLVDGHHTEALSIQNVQYQLSNPDLTIEDILPATDTQVYDVLGTVDELKTGIEYIALNFDAPLNDTLLISAIDMWVKKHQVLRTTFVQVEGRFWQVVLHQKVEVNIVANADSAASLCNDDANKPITLGGAFTKVWLARGKTGCTLVLRLSHAQYDGVSLPNMLEDLSTILQGQPLQSIVPFTSYLSYTSSTPAIEAAQSYWRKLLVNSTNTTWPTIPTTASTTRSALLQTMLSSPPNLSHGITEATLLTSAWSLTLFRALGSADVTFGNIVSTRNIPIPDAERIAGPCYAQTPVRVSFQEDWTGLELMEVVQAQRQESSAFDWLGHEKITKGCTDWGVEGTGYGSITHYIGDEGEVEEFGGMKCKVDVIHPHGVPALPMKVVMWKRKEDMFLGVVGPESEEAILRDVLVQIKEAVEFLADSGRQRLADFLNA